MKSCGDNGERLLEAVWPALAFAVLYELLLYGMEHGLGVVNRMLIVGGADAAVLAFQTVHAADYQALFAAAGMSVSLAVILRFCIRRGEIGFTRHLRGDALTNGAAVIGGLCLGMFLNGALSSAGSSAAQGTGTAAQGAVVSPLVGIAVYGVLTPLAEESIFRGVTLTRLYEVLLRVLPEKGKTHALNDFGRSTDQQANEGDNFGNPEIDFAPNRKLKSWKDMAFWLAAAASSVLFGVYHGNLLQGIYAACMGLAFCCLLRLTENLGAAVLAHGAMNVLTLVFSQKGAYNELSNPSFLAAMLGISVCCGGFVVIRRRMLYC